MTKYPLILLSTLLIGILLLSSCDKDNDVNIFTIEDDKALGKKVAKKIEADTSDQDVLDTTAYSEAYNYLFRIRDKILSSGKVQYRDEFVWRTRIIDDTTLNAFCAPGGYIYVYTGLIKYLDSEEELAGVIAHEIAHADKRHVTDQLTKKYGISVLLDVVLGEDRGTLVQIANGLAQLKFSRNNESEADEYSVIYMCPTDYQADGAAGFFQKLLNQGQTGPPQFLSTHPSPDNRVEAIQSKEQELGCDGDQTYDSRYQDFQNSLP